MLYKGFEIKRVQYQGCVNYAVPALTRPGEQEEIAPNIKTARTWVDLHLWDKYINGGEV